MKKNMKNTLFALVFVLAPFTSHADCSSPSGKEGEQIYNKDYKSMQFCDGTDWQAMGAVQNVTTGASIPTGAIMAFNLASCPSGWSEYTLARGRFLRGIDSAGLNDPDGVRTLGSTQADTLASHLHTVNPPSTTSSSNGAHTHTVTDRYSASGNVNKVPYTGASIDVNETTTRTTSSNGAHTHSLDIAEFNSGSTGDSETRPKNVAVLYCEKD